MKKIFFCNKRIYKPSLKIEKETISPAQSSLKKNFHIRETKHLLTDADSSTDAIGGWTKNTQKPNFFEKRKKITKIAKTQKRIEI